MGRGEGIVLEREIWGGVKQVSRGVPSSWGEKERYSIISEQKEEIERWDSQEVQVDVVEKWIDRENKEINQIIKVIVW